MKPVRLIILAMTVLVVAGCANRDERSRLGDLIGGDKEPETATVANADESSAAAPRPESTLILTALLESAAGQAITAADQLALERTTQTTLETVPIGNESVWRNPQSGSHGPGRPAVPFKKPAAPIVGSSLRLS